MIIPTHDEIVTVISQASKLEKTINDLLEKEEYEGIMDIFAKPEIAKVIGRNQNIYILSIMTRLIMVEIKKTGKTSLQGKNTSQIIRIYKILTLYLRRIEFNLPINLQAEIVDYIKQEKLSLPIVVGIISNNSVIIQKQAILDCLAIWWGKVYE